MVEQKSFVKKALKRALKVHMKQGLSFRSIETRITDKKILLKAVKGQVVYAEWCPDETWCVETQSLKGSGLPGKYTLNYLPYGCVYLSTKKVFKWLTKICPNVQVITHRKMYEAIKDMMDEQDQADDCRDHAKLDPLARKFWNYHCHPTIIFDFR